MRTPSRNNTNAHTMIGKVASSAATLGDRPCDRGNMRGVAAEIARLAGLVV